MSRVSIETKNGEVVVSVRDRGVGIAPEDQRHLFQKFARLSSAESRDIPGTGLGLYIVKGLVEAHRGHVWVDSAPGKGSTFSFSLPLADATGVSRAV